MLKKITLFTLVLGIHLTANAVYTPVALTAASFNADVVAEGVGSPAGSTTAALDAATNGYAFAAQNYQYAGNCTAVPAGQGLPNSGSFTGAASGVPYQFAAYNGNNALQLTNTSPSGLLGFASQQAGTELYLLGTTGSGTGVVDITIIFADATTQVFTGVTINDWYGTSNIGLHAARIPRNATACQGLEYGTNGPNLYEINLSLLAANYNKPIASINITKTNATVNSFVNIMAVSLNGPCTGAVAGNVSSSAANVCPGQVFQLSSTSFGGDMIQWESSPQGAGAWSAISGATTVSYTVSGGQTTAMDYRAVVSCSNSGGVTDVSNTVSIGMSPFYVCYCSPTTGTTLHNLASDVVTNVTIPNTTLNSSNATNSSTGYTRTDPSVAGNTGDLMQGLTYTVRLTVIPGASGYPAEGWIDFDQNGSFDPGEYLSFSTTGTLSTVNVTIPATAVTGMTGMRIRFSSPVFGAGGACATGGGETEDYVLNILPSVNCSTPNTPVATGPAAVCANTVFTLTSGGGSVASGLAYQWESSPQNAGTWTAIPNATSSDYTVAGGITAATDYQLVTTCTSGGANSVSNMVSVGVNPIAVCYCSPMNGVALHSGGGNYLTNVTIVNTTLNSSGNTNTTTGYSQVSPTIASNTADLMPGSSYTISGTVFHPAYASLFQIEGWIDYDQSGTFDAAEYFILTTIAGAVKSTSVSIPSTAIAGQTGMRIRMNFLQYGASGACTNNGQQGETEDYVVNMLPTTNCTGTPNTPVATAPQAVCPNTNFILNASGYSVGNGISYQWESSLPGANNWAPVANATTANYTVTGGISSAMDYQLVTNCISGANSISNIVSIQVDAAQCVCTPAYYYNGCNITISGTAVTIAINSVDMTGVGNTAIHNTNTGCSPGGFANYTGLSAELPQGSNSYILLLTPVNTSGAGNTANIGVWIDLNDDADFNDPGEQVGTGVNVSTGGATAGIPVLLTIPATAPLGVHRMRVMLANTVNGSIDPCGGTSTHVLGEAEDYRINIVIPTALSLLNIEAVNEGRRNRIGWQTATEDRGDYFLLERSTDGENYTVSGTISAKGYASGYSFTDEHPVAGANYYRLKMYDISGKVAYSRVVTAIMKSENTFSVEAYPNPVTIELTVKVHGEMSDDAMVSVVDMTGQVMEITKMNRAETRVDMSRLAPGCYFIRYSDSQHTHALKINKN